MSSASRLKLRRDLPWHIPLQAGRLSLWGPLEAGWSLYPLPRPSGPEGTEAKQGLLQQMCRWESPGMLALEYWPQGNGAIAGCLRPDLLMFETKYLR